MNTAGARPLAFLLLLGSLGPGYAASLTLEFDASTRFSGGMASARVTLTNQGDEQAKSVYVEALLGDQRISSSEIEALAVGASHTWDIQLGPPPKRPGVYTVAFRAHYSDIYGHPASGLHTIPLYTGQVPARSPIDARLSSATIDPSGELMLSMGAKVAFTSDVTCRLILPSEILCNAPEVRLRISGVEPVEHRFAIENNGALRGSRYRVYVVIDYVHDGLHGSTEEAALVEVAPHRKMQNTERNLWITIIAALVIAFLAAQFFPRRRSGKIAEG